MRKRVRKKGGKEKRGKKSGGEREETPCEPGSAGVVLGMGLAPHPGMDGASHRHSLVHRAGTVRLGVRIRCHAFL